VGDSHPGCPTLRFLDVFHPVLTIKHLADFLEAPWLSSALVSTQVCFCAKIFRAMVFDWCLERTVYLVLGVEFVGASHKKNSVSVCVNLGRIN
jgi:hypothetical protein